MVILTRRLLTVSTHTSGGFRYVSFPYRIFDLHTSLVFDPIFIPIFLYIVCPLLCNLFRIFISPITPVFIELITIILSVGFAVISIIFSPLNLFAPVALRAPTCTTVFIHVPLSASTAFARFEVFDPSHIME